VSIILVDSAWAINVLSDNFSLSNSCVGVSLLPLKLMAQSRRGVVRMLEAKVRPLVVAIPRFIQITPRLD
jgi:hypothetical protein